MLFNIDEKQLMLELKNKDERALKICMNKYYRYVVYIVENIIGSALPYEDKEAVVSNVFAAEPLTDDPNMIEWKYTVFANESLQKVVEEGVIPNAYARYTWRGITLKNGEVAILTPSNNSMGLYCNSGRYITINYTLSRSAFHRSRVRAYVAGPSSEFVREITASGLRSGFTTQATDYYYGMVTNLSSDAFTIKSFSITF